MILEVLTNVALVRGEVQSARCCSRNAVQACVNICWCCRGRMDHMAHEEDPSLDPFIR